jgi:hypothetical protein
MLLESVTELPRTEEINRLWFNIGISMFFVSIQAMGIGYISLIVRTLKSRTARRLRRL